MTLTSGTATSGTARAGGSGADGGAWNSGGGDNGVLGGTVDYDLGYDANGWDTQGFRSPAASYLDSRDTAHVGSTPQHGRRTWRQPRADGQRIARRTAELGTGTARAR